MSDKRKAAAPPPKISFAFSFLVIAVIAIAANIVQILADRWLETGEDSWRTLTLVVGGGFALVTAVLAFLFGRRTIRLFASLRFASAVVAVLAVATVAGTMILQGQPAEVFEDYYGGLTGFLRALHTDDLFHSFWYLAVLALTAVSLAVDAMLRIWDIARGKRDGWVNLGFILTHLGITLSLAGGLLSMLGGEKGMLHLVVGESKSSFVRQGARASEPRTATLPFEVRLDEFEVEHYEDAYSLYIYEFLPGTNARGRRNLEVIGALESKVGEKHRFAGKHQIEVLEVIAPEESPAAPTGSATHTLALDGGEPKPIRVGETISFDGGIRVKLLNFLPHFNYDLKTKRAISLSDQPENPAVEILATNEADGETLYRGWLFAMHAGFTMDGHGGPLSKRLSYRFQGGHSPHAPVATAPTLVLSLTRDGKPLLPPFRHTVGDQGRLPIEQGEYAIAYAQKGDRIKQYHSKLSLRRGGEEIVPSTQISVNHPLWAEGWALYQANFDPRNPRYSGIQVVKDPGLNLVYLGLIVMGLGVIHILYLRGWRPGRKRRKKKDEEVEKSTVAEATDTGATEAGGAR